MLRAQWGDLMNLEILKEEENCYTLKELLDLYSNYIKNPMVVTNSNYELLYYTKTKEVDDVYKSATKTGAWSLELIAIANNAFKDNNEYQILDSINKNQRRLFYKIEHNNILGYLVLLEEKEYPFDILDIPLLKHLANLIGKILYLENYKSNSNNKENFYKSLLNKEYKTKDIIKTKINEYKINLDSSLLMISLQNIDINQNNYLKVKLESILSINTIFAYGDIVLIFLNDNNINTSKLQDFLKDNHLKALFVPKITNYFSFESIYKSLSNLLIFLEKTENNVLYNEEYYKIYLPFFSDKFNLDEILNYIDSKILNIYNYDKENNTDNIDTIYYYLTYDKSLAKTASKLYIHKNTVSYRLLKLYDMFDIEFNNQELNKIYLYSIFLVKYYNYKMNNSN